MDIKIIQQKLNETVGKIILVEEAIKNKEFSKAKQMLIGIQQGASEKHKELLDKYLKVLDEKIESAP